MTTRFSHALATSTLLHGAAVALIAVIAYLAGLTSSKPLHLFELVAGEGDNYLATEAPALGTPEGNPQLVAPPPQAAPAVVVSTTKAPAPPAEKTIDLSKSLKTAVTKSIAKNKAEDERLARLEAARQAKLTKEEFDRQNKAKAAPKTPAPKTPVLKIDAKGLARGVTGGSTANTTGGAGGRAMTAAQGAMVERYTALLKDRLQQNLEDQAPPGMSDTLVATAVMRVEADGSLSSGTIRKTSGNTEFDKAVLDAIRLTRLPERPAGFATGLVELDFKMRDKAAE
jgi:colicin import membrane protein